MDFSIFIYYIKFLCNIFLQPCIIIPAIIIGLITGLIIYYSKENLNMICPICTKKLEEYMNDDILLCSDCNILVGIQTHTHNQSYIIKDNEDNEDNEVQNKELPIYTITTLSDMYDLKCIGFYTDAIIAIESVFANSNNMCEYGNYTYCVIEEINPGLFYYPKVEVWFEWSYELQKYIKIDKKPEIFKYLNTFAFG